MEGATGILSDHVMHVNQTDLGLPDEDVNVQMEERAEYKTIIAIPMKYCKGDHPTLDELVYQRVGYGKSEELLEKIRNVTFNKDKPHVPNIIWMKEMLEALERDSRMSKKGN